MADPGGLLDLLDLVVARSDGIVPSSVTDTLAEEARRARMRHGFLGEVLVVALAGGTGGGKSSLLNALVGERVVPTGVVRPTTQRATAVYAPDPAVDLEPLLSELGVDDRVLVGGAGDVVFVDLPDFDSTERAHRHVVETVLPRVDAVVWVLDPEKYADPVLHRDFLARLVPYQDAFVFVLNQVDRLGDEAGEARASLATWLAVDGFEAPEVVETVAASKGELPPDVEALRTHLSSRLDTKATAIVKLAADLRIAANDGWRACRDVDTSTLDREGADGAALAAATFVSLGVAAWELLASMGPRPGVTASV